MQKVLQKWYLINYNLNINSYEMQNIRATQDQSQSHWTSIGNKLSFYLQMNMK